MQELSRIRNPLIYVLIHRSWSLAVPTRPEGPVNEKPEKNKPSAQLPWLRTAQTVAVLWDMLTLLPRSALKIFDSIAKCSLSGGYIEIGVPSYWISTWDSKAIFTKVTLLKMVPLVRRCLKQAAFVKGIGVLGHRSGIFSALSLILRKPAWPQSSSLKWKLNNARL